jgi:hypothetical protein
MERRRSSRKEEGVAGGEERADKRNKDPWKGRWDSGKEVWLSEVGGDMRKEEGVVGRNDEQ